MSDSAERSCCWTHCANSQGIGTWVDINGEMLPVCEEHWPGRLRTQVRVEAKRHDDFVNEILLNASEHYDGDDAGEDIALRYVRDLEAIADAAEAVLNETGAGLYRDGNGEAWRQLQDVLGLARPLLAADRRP